MKYVPCMCAYVGGMLTRDKNVTEQQWTFVSLYKSMVRSRLDYCTLFCLVTIQKGRYRGIETFRKGSKNSNENDTGVEKSTL